MDFVDVLLSTLRSQPYGFFVTPTPTGPCARLVQPLRIDDDAAVWFATSSATRKAQEIAAGEGAATYAVEDRAAFAYACVHGTAQLIRDARLAEQMWDPGLDAFFPNGPAGDDVVLVHLQASRADLMSFTAGVHPAPYGLAAEKIVLR